MKTWTPAARRAFAAKMKAARERKRNPDYPGGVHIAAADIDAAASWAHQAVAYYGGSVPLADVVNRIGNYHKLDKASFADLMQKLGAKLKTHGVKIDRPNGLVIRNPHWVPTDPPHVLHVHGGAGMSERERDRLLMTTATGRDVAGHYETPADARKRRANEKTKKAAQAKAAREVKNAEQRRARKLKIDLRRYIAKHGGIDVASLKTYPGTILPEVLEQKAGGRRLFRARDPNARRGTLQPMSWERLQEHLQADGWLQEHETDRDLGRMLDRALVEGRKILAPSSYAEHGRRAARNPQLLVVTNPSKAPLDKKRAAALLRAYRTFHRCDPKAARPLPAGMPDLIALGTLKQINYAPRRGARRTAEFWHRFKGSPVLAATLDGRRLFIIPDAGKPFRVKWTHGIVEQGQALD